MKLITLTVKEYGRYRKESGTTGVWLTGLVRQELGITESLEMSEITGIDSSQLEPLEMLSQ